MSNAENERGRPSGLTDASDLPRAARPAPPLKRGTCYASLDERGFVTEAARPVAGVFLHDTRHLSLWRWHLPGFELVDQTTASSTLVQHWSRFAEHAQDVLIRRELVLEPDGLSDTLVIGSEALEACALTVRLDTEADFRDLLELRGLGGGGGGGRTVGRNEPLTRHEGDVRITRYVARDEVVSSTRIEVQGMPVDAAILLEAGQTHRIEAHATFSSTLGVGERRGGSGLDGDGMGDARAGRRRAEAGVRRHRRADFTLRSRSSGHDRYPALRDRVRT